MKNSWVNIILGFFVCFVFVQIMVSCEQKELCYYHPHVAPVKVKVDWDSLGYTNLSSINGMTAHLFAKQGMDQKINTTVTTNNIHEIIFDVLEGKYDVSVFNNTPDEYTTLKFNDLTDHYKASVQSAEMRVPDWFTKYNVKTQDKYVAHQPEWIARGYSKDIQVTKEMVEIAEEEYLSAGFSMNARSVTLVDEVVPDSLTCTFTMKVKLKGIDNFYQARAIVGGLAIGKKILDLSPLSETVSFYAGLESWKFSGDSLSSDGTGTIFGNITCFGLPAGKTPENLLADDIWLTIEILLVDKKTIITSDVSLKIGDLIEYDPDYPLNLRMKEAILFPVELPYVNPEDGSEGGFGVGLEDWEEEEIDIIDN